MAVIKKKTTVKSKALKTKARTAIKKSKRPVTTKRSAKKTTISQFRDKLNSLRGYKYSNNLNVWNWVIAVINILQGVVIIILSNEKLATVTTNYQTTDVLAHRGSSATVLATRQLFDVNIVYLVVSFLFVSAVVHVLLATWCRSRYKKDIKSGINKLRWLDYSLSAGLMVVTIALLTGIQDVSTLLMLFVFMVVAGLAGLTMELVNRKVKSINWSPYIIAVIATVLPWLVLAIYFLGSGKYAISGSIATYVYYILGSLLVLSVAPLFITLFIYKKYNRWTEYRYAEKSYMVISVIARAALAWQVFAGLLR